MRKSTAAPDANDENEIRIIFRMNEAIIYGQMLLVWEREINQRANNFQLDITDKWDYFILLAECWRWPLVVCKGILILTSCWQAGRWDACKPRRNSIMIFCVLPDVGSEMLRARADHIIESNLCIYLIRRCSWPRNGANQTHTAATMSNRRSEWREIWQAPPHSSQEIKNHAESGQTPSRQQQQQQQ